MTNADFFGNFEMKSATSKPESKLQEPELEKALFVNMYFLEISKFYNIFLKLL